MRFIVAVFVLLGYFVPIATRAQVSEIKKAVEEDKRASDARRSEGRRATGGGGGVDAPDFADFLETSGIAEAIAVYTVGAAIYGLYYVGDRAQRATLDGCDRHPERVSLEASANAMFDVGEGNIGYAPRLRFNWGIFAADVRFCHVEDYSGALNSIDWHLPIVRIPINNLKLEYGIGGITLLDPSKTYFESSLGLDWRLLRQRANISGGYRWSQRTRVGGRFRQEAGVEVDYETHRWGKVRLSPMVGYTYQNYFENDGMQFVKAGLKLRVY